MTDIVQYLREAQGPPLMSDTGKTLTETAADEIERLQAQLAEARAECKSLYEQGLQNCRIGENFKKRAEAAESARDRALDVVKAAEALMGFYRRGFSFNPTISALDKLVETLRALREAKDG